jgi:lysophospholipase L1-like esterase
VGYRQAASAVARAFDRPGRRVALLASVICIQLAVGGLAARAMAPGEGRPECARTRWQAAWMAAPAGVASLPAATDRSGAGRTLRMVVHIQGDAPTMRVRLSNALSPAPLAIGGATVARRTQAAGVDATTTRTLTFAHAHTAVIKPGEHLVSDPVTVPVRPGTDVAVSIFLPEPTTALTEHPYAFTTNWIAAGDALADAAGTSFTQPDQRWFVLDEVDTLASGRKGAVVGFGDSITDGAASTTDANRRWTDVLATRGVPVLNAGISGNRLLADHPFYGAAGVARFTDVLDRPGVCTVVILEGINDIGASSGMSARATSSRITGALTALVAEAHARGLSIWLATLTPAGDDASPVAMAGYSDARARTTRQMVNDWIRTQRMADGVIDFDAAARDPQYPDRLRSSYNSGDNIHPSDAGYGAMGSYAADALRARRNDRPVFVRVPAHESGSRSRR